jgi:hypothetical protein
VHGEHFKKFGRAPHDRCCRSRGSSRGIRLFGFWKKLKEAKAAQRGLTEAFKAQGHDFMAMEPSVHEALVKEAMATGVEATVKHFDMINSTSSAPVIIEYYKQRSKRFGG